jgi:hypothetical protein
MKSVMRSPTSRLVTALAPIAALAIVSALATPAVAQEGGYAAPPPSPPPSDPPADQPASAAGSTRGSARTRGGGGSPDILRPSTRPMWFVAGAGPDFHGINLGKNAPGLGGKIPARFALAFDFGYHFEGAGEGPAIGATIEQTIGNGFYTMSPAAKFWWDIMIADMAIYVTPFGKAGYLLGVNGSAAHGFNLGIGLEGRVVLDDRWMLFFRPIQLDTVIGDFFGETVHLNVFVLLGGGVTF